MLLSQIFQLFLHLLDFNATAALLQSIFQVLDLIFAALQFLAKVPNRRYSWTFKVSLICFMCWSQSWIRIQRILRACVFLALVHEPMEFNGMCALTCISVYKWSEIEQNGSQTNNKSLCTSLQYLQLGSEKGSERKRLANFWHILRLMLAASISLLKRRLQWKGSERKRLANFWHILRLMLAASISFLKRRLQ